MKLSILIPSYNRPKQLYELLTGIAESNLKLPFEVVVSDDCSPKSEQIQNIIKQFEDSKLYIRYFSQPKNLGEVLNKNFLLKNALGEFCVFVGDDDLIVRGSIERLMKIICKRTAPDLVLMGYYETDDHLTFTRLKSPMIGGSINTHTLVKCGALNFDWFPFWYAHPATYAFRREKVSYFRDDVGFAEDLAHLLDYLLSDTKIYVSNFPFIFWRKGFLNIASDRLEINQSYDTEKHILSRKLLFDLIKKVSEESSVFSLTWSNKIRHLRSMRRTGWFESFLAKLMIIQDVTKFSFLRFFNLIFRPFT